MERQIAYDKLAREDRFVRMRAREVAEAFPVLYLTQLSRKMYS